MTEITSTSNSNVQYWKALSSDAKFRRKEGKLLVEGKNLVKDLIEKNLVEVIIATTNWNNPDFIVTPSVYKSFSQLENPEGVAAVVSMPKPKPLETADTILVLDRLQDPGNVGTLIRTASAFSIDLVATILPACDPWNEKALRAGKGAHFSIGINSCSLDELHTWAAKKEAQIYIADLHGDSSETLRKNTGPFALVLGNEASGPSSDLKGKRVTIPMKQEMESLNVSQAGAILLYLLQCKTI